ncbi:unnamed protein product [Parajaminaea phylloscopi]
MKLATSLYVLTAAAICLASSGSAAPTAGHDGQWDAKHSSKEHHQGKEWDDKHSNKDHHQSKEWDSKHGKEEHHGKQYHRQQKYYGKDKAPAYFTSAYATRAVRDDWQFEVADKANPYGLLDLQVNADKRVLCYDIRLVDLKGEFSSEQNGKSELQLTEKMNDGGEAKWALSFKEPSYKRTDAAGANIYNSAGCTWDLGKLDLERLKSTPTNFHLEVSTGRDGSRQTAVRGKLIRSEVEVDPPKWYTSTIKTEATPDQVVNANNSRVAGLEGAKTSFELKLNTEQDILCYDIKTTGYNPDEDGDYSSPAKTATHAHEGVFGRSGPPRLAFKNPKKEEDDGHKTWHERDNWHHDQTLHSAACVKGPFTTGLLNKDRLDTGSESGFTLKKLEDNPEGFFGDFHTEKFLAGAVRGNFYRAQDHH